MLFARFAVIGDSPASQRARLAVSSARVRPLVHRRPTAGGLSRTAGAGGGSSTSTCPWADRGPPRPRHDAVRALLAPSRHDFSVRDADRAWSLMVALSITRDHAGLHPRSWLLAVAAVILAVFFVLEMRTDIRCALPLFKNSTFRCHDRRFLTGFGMLAPSSSSRYLPGFLVSVPPTLVSCSPNDARLIGRARWWARPWCAFVYLSSDGRIVVMLGRMWLLSQVTVNTFASKSVRDIVSSRLGTFRSTSRLCRLRCRVTSSRCLEPDPFWSRSADD